MWEAIYVSFINLRVDLEAEHHIQSCLQKIMGQNNYAKIINNIVHPSNEDCFIFFQMKHKESSTVREAPPSSTGGLGGVFGPSKPLAKKEGGLVSQIASKFQNNSSESSPPPANSKFNENRYTIESKTKRSVASLWCKMSTF